MFLPIDFDIVERANIVTSTVLPSITPTTTSIITKVEASTRLTWWQLLCIGVGSVLALVGVLVFWWMHRNKKKEEAKKKEAAETEQRQMKERKAQMGGSDFDTDDSEYDSVSDGGTIHQSRRRRERRRGGIERRGKMPSRSRRAPRDRYESESDTFSSDASSITYRERRSGRRRGNGRDDGHRRYDGDIDRGRDTDRDRDKDPRAKRTRSPDYPSRRRRSATPPPRREKPFLPVSPLDRDNPVREKFRDSVFSTFTSMKNAAVKLKYVEAKVKLKKQLEEEAAIEAKRKAKIREANKEIEDSKRKLETAEHSSSSLRPLIPPAKPLTAHLASEYGSPRSTPSLPTPPVRALRRQQATHQTSVDRQVDPVNHQRRLPGQPVQPAVRRPPAMRGGSVDTIAKQSRVSGTQAPRRKRTLPAPTHQPASNKFVEAWLAHPSIVQPHHTGSVYLPVTAPRDRPRIPPGGLAPAPTPPKKRQETIPASVAGTGPMSSGTGKRAGYNASPVAVPGGKKWADRLRERR